MKRLRIQPRSRSYYSASISNFRKEDANSILGRMAQESNFPDRTEAKQTWAAQIATLKQALKPFQGRIMFEFSIPRMGKRIDAVLLIKHIIFVLEFKGGAESHFSSEAMDQVFDYALDLKNFHRTSHKPLICPILIAVEAKRSQIEIGLTPHLDRVLFPIKCSPRHLAKAIQRVLHCCQGPAFHHSSWERGSYYPTPTIIEAAMSLYRHHTVADISRRDASARNLTVTSNAIDKIIRESKRRNTKGIVFVTGVPGAGKTLVGLNIATEHIDRKSELFSVFLSGNGPLVRVLQEALARDKVARENAIQRNTTKTEALSEVKLFVQNVHNFRDEYVDLPNKRPIEHVALFDEAQRAWNKEQTKAFMTRKRNHKKFNMSEPEFLISCMNRHRDWAVIVCLVGGGQEINTGEAGISEWLRAVKERYPQWNIYISSRLSDSEYGAALLLESLKIRKGVRFQDELHLSVSMRSFRAEKVSLLMKQILDLDERSAKDTLRRVKKAYPIVLTRHLPVAKAWLKAIARGSQRYGIVVSSYAERLKAHGVFVRSPIDPVNWFLDPKEDTRSSYYLEDVATEFSIQGLELDWSCVVWDADFRYSSEGWKHHDFVGTRWNDIKKEDRRNYQRNAYRVLLTRARQGMIIVVPKGDESDPTRLPEFYDPTYKYLSRIGIPVLD